MHDRLLPGYVSAAAHVRAGTLGSSGLPPSKLFLADLNTAFLNAFLNYLEKKRSNKTRTRNLRLTAIRSFFRYAALEAPQHSGLIQQVLATPNKRCSRALVGFLTRPEIEAILAAVDRTTWTGRRDYSMLLVAMQTGLRLSELTGLRCRDVALGSGAHVHCLGKGRKERGTPLTKSAARVLAAWAKEPQRGDGNYLFPNISGGRLSHDAVQDLVRKHVSVARQKCPSLKQKNITPHVLRHTAAMELMQAGVDRSMIALWLGHESIETTQLYLDANLALKEEVLAKTKPINGKPSRYRPGDRLLGFLRSL